ncbi:TB2/DP1, HVA22 family-domain-containing protein [Gorgonomyces haynaldii]|nr:TB2/DP1, HVA22 family-domain-containing protein [Gorgonomyces haynaldii]
MRRSHTAIVTAPKEEKKEEKKAEKVHPLEKAKKDIEKALKPLHELKQVQDLEKKLGLTTLGLLIVSLIIVLWFILLTFNVKGAFLSDLFCYSYPSYHSLVAINKKKDHDLWLSYWIIFGFMKFLENAGEILLRVLPFYYLTKVVFIVWLIAPQSQGAVALHQIMLKHWVTMVDTVLPKKPEKKEEKKEETASLSAVTQNQASQRWSYVRSSIKR